MKERFLHALLSRGMISLDSSGRYYQTEDNCFEIAQLIAEQLGHRFPETRRELGNLIFEEKARRLWGPSRHSESSCWVLVYEPDRVELFGGTVHVVIQDVDTEYNFGASEEDGFVVVARIPLTAVILL